MFSIRFAIQSEVGRVRKNNQDAGYASPNMLLVTDGMGGAAAGDLASAVAASEASRGDTRSADSEEMLERIAGIVARANTKLSVLVEDDLELDGMGTTFCGVMFNGRQFALAHIGDSRGYRIREGKLEQLTHDHSWVQSLIDEGKITPEQAATHPHRSLILKVLNGQDGFDPDFDLFDAELGDRLLFCSDGLSGLIDEDELVRLALTPDIDEAVSALVSAANEAGGHDNITVTLGEVVKQDDELDTLPGQLVGSAIEVSIPRPSGRSDDKDPPYPVPEPPATDQDSEEVARYAPTDGKRRWPGVLGALLAIALVLGGGIWAVTAFSKTRYFVASEEGHVAIYNGLPGQVLGVSFNELEERTDIVVSNLPTFYQEAVTTTIPVGSYDGAQATVQALRSLADACVQTRKERLLTTTAPSDVSTASAPGPGLPTAPGLESPAPGNSESPGFLLPSELPTLDAEQADSGGC